MPNGSTGTEPTNEAQDDTAVDADHDAPKWHDLGAFIREQRRITDLSVRRLAELTGVSNPYLSQIERGLRRPSADILQQIARGLQISSETLYEKAGILDTDARDHDLVSDIRRDPHLNDDQKKALIQIYRSFRAGGEIS
ncbi:MAG: helix-turn-helix transcriptional regulator [Actinomycetia bacterium]|nr:helix-turn-helix transcriptional regulator [Actinomycetes bacterium]